MKTQINLIPDFFRVFFKEEDVISVPDHWQRPRGYNFSISLSTSYKNYLAAIVTDISHYFGIDSRTIGSDLTKSDPAALLSEKKLLELDHKIKSSNYGTSILFKEKEIALEFVKVLNIFLEKEYEELENQLKIRMLLGTEIPEYQDHSVIFTSRKLAEHFITSFSVPYFFRTLEVVKINKEGIKGIEAQVKFYTELCGQCHLCGKPLTDEFSKKTGVGPVCAKKKLGIKRTTSNHADIEIAIAKIKEVAANIGIIGPIFIPKSQISKLK